MKCVQKSFASFSLLIFFAVCAMAQMPVTRSMWTSVEDRAKDYVKLREEQRSRLPKIAKEAKPEEILAYKVSLQKSVQAARTNALPGDVFAEPSATAIRKVIKEAFRDFERSELRKTVLEADTKGVPLKVNAVYPESKELVEMSPALLLTLPQLPKELRYRFIGRSLAILDRDTGVIVDFMKDALP